VAIVSGGTGLYIKALCEGLDEMPAIKPLIYEEVNRLYEQNGMPWLMEQIKSVDPIYAHLGEMSNPSRMLRALVFTLSTGHSILQFRTGIKKTRPFEMIKIGLERPREELYERINKRVDLMIKQGLVQEAKALWPLKNLKSLNTVGYTELFDYFEGKTSLHQSIEKIKQHSRNYAKRQMTWFKKDTSVEWMPADDPNLASKILAKL
jgi:tRNA dimethylallyltransferase